MALISQKQRSFASASLVSVVSGGFFLGITVPKTEFYLKICLSYLSNSVVLLHPLFGLRCSKDLY